MPMKDGYQTSLELNQFFEQFPEWKCPIIAYTGNVEKEKIDKCCDSGMNGYLSKPIN